uniref:Uncharacterized protein n=1 Tax=Rhizophora mucronata TaxID=61149 RepID=A0A2P2NDA7_RHIMU
MESGWSACWVCTEMGRFEPCCGLRCWAFCAYRPVVEFSGYDRGLGIGQGGLC